MRERRRRARASKSKTLTSGPASAGSSAGGGGGPGESSPDCAHRAVITGNHPASASRIFAASTALRFYPLHNTASKKFAAPDGRNATESTAGQSRNQNNHRGRRGPQRM